MMQPLRRWELGSCIVELWRDSLVTTFPSGQFVIAGPSLEDPENSWRKHDLAHTWAAMAFGLPWSQVLYNKAHNLPSPINAGFEERLAIALTKDSDWQL